MSQEKRDINLQRRQAMRRKGFVWEQTGTLRRLELSARRWREDSNSCVEKRSSLDLTPTLLGIYDQIASSHLEDGEGPVDQSDGSASLTIQTVQHEAMDQNESTKSLPAVLKDKTNLEPTGNIPETGDVVKPVIKVDSEIVLGVNVNKVKMEGNENSNITDIDSKKRPLSLSSMSSSSTSSLPRQRKRPNLCEYSDSSSSGQLDIEKLDNLLYIDDNAEIETPNPTDDELSLYSLDKEEKTKCTEDSDSQISLDQSSFRDQTIMTTLPNFHELDSSIILTSSEPSKSSATELHGPLENSGKLPRETPVRTPSRTSTGSRSSGSSMKQSGHYVSHVQRVVGEIVETERLYVKHLHEIKVGYYEYILSTASLNISGPELNYLFGNIVDIYKFSCQFLEQLESCGMDPIQVADCFVRNNQGFVIYADYCTNYPSAVAILTKVMHDSHLSEVFKQRQLAMGHSLPLGAYLLKPVQRVLKYHLLLQNILKHYSKSDPGYDKLMAAFDHMTDMSHQINEMKRKHEHAIRVQEIQSQLEDYEGEDFTRLGELVLEGSFRIHGIKASRQMFLFERGVIIAKRKEDGMLSCKVSIPCATLMLVESIPGEPLNFQILPFNNPKLTHTIHARNLDQKRKWCREIKRLMLESYSSKIPENVKDLIIQKLGKSKEEEDFANIGGTETSKSHVSTPDYLEKRQKVRRKSGNLIPGIPEILRQKARKAQGRARSETPSPRPSPSAGKGLPYDKLSSQNTDVEHYGFRANIPGLSPQTRKNIRNQETYEGLDQPYVHKRPVSIQRSHSFQLATSRDPLKSLDLTKESSSMEDLIQSDGPPIRTKSFRLATRLSPIKLEGSDETDSNTESSNVDKVLTDRQDNDNVSPELRKSVGNEMKKLGNIPYKYNTLGFKNEKEIGMGTLSLRKRGMYSSMPTLNCETTKSPRLSRLHSDRSADNSPSINRTSVTQTRQLELKKYFNWDKDSLRNKLSQKDNNKENESNSLSREAKPVLAFHDVFSNLRKSSENLSSKSVPQKTISLTQPKTFTSKLKTSASKMESRAKLDKWKTDDKFTKGSLVDLSHLKEDPWVPSKVRASTESSIKYPNKIASDVSELNGSHKRESSYGDKPTNKQKNRLSFEEGSRRHIRTQSFTGDDRSFSRDNLDWLVYANRNSIPVAGISTEEILHSKYCTPPRGSMIPPSSKTPQHENVVSLYATPSRSNVIPKALTDFVGSENHNETATDSSVSLSATNTSSETCSSPDILKDSVFDEAFSPEKFFSQEHCRLSRSFSSPENKRSSKFRKDFSEDRPSSMDILGEVRHIEASEKLVAEMEHYLKHSSSSSSSLNSNNNKFPKSVPTFAQSERETYKRDSVVSSGSTSSYESAREELESEHDESLVETIKSKLHNITAKFSGKKLNMDHQFKNSQGEYSNPSSPIKLKHDEYPAKVSPLSHNLSLRVKSGHQKSPEPDLPSLLLESKPGSEVIGSRMANPDFDDYATFSLPRTQPPQSSVDEDKVNVKRRSEAYFRPTTCLAGSKSLSHSGLASKYSPVTSLRNLNIQQSDSAFSIQSADNDNSIFNDSPRSDNDVESATPEAADNFYEKRLSIAFSNDEAFRDSAVYCDDTDTPLASPREPTIPSKIPIREYVQQLEEKNKKRPPSPVKVKHREPSSIIKQRMESLQANLENPRSSSTSRSVSLATSRTPSQSTSRDTSRAPSEEKQITSKALLELMETKFPMDRTLSVPGDHSVKFKDDDEVFRSRSNTSSSGKLKPAFSLGKLDQLSTDVDNLTIMKGWVRQLIDKFQSEK